MVDKIREQIGYLRAPSDNTKQLFRDCVDAANTLESLLSENSELKERLGLLEADHDRTYEAYVALLNEVGRLNPNAIKKVD